MYDIKYTRYPANRPFKVQLRSDQNYHTHMRTLKEAIDLANFAKYKHMPDAIKPDYLESLIRISNDEVWSSKLIKILHKKVGRCNGDRKKIPS